MVSIYYVAKGSSVERDAGDAKPLRAHAHYIKGTKSSALVYHIDSVATRDCALPWDTYLSLRSCQEPPFAMWWGDH